MHCCTLFVEKNQTYAENYTESSNLEFLERLLKESWVELKQGQNFAHEMINACSIQKEIHEGSPNVTT